VIPSSSRDDLALFGAGVAVTTLPALGCLVCPVDPVTPDFHSGVPHMLGLFSLDATSMIKTFAFPPNWPSLLSVGLVEPPAVPLRRLFRFRFLILPL
jgi:hypothetical protein